MDERIGRMRKREWRLGDEREDEDEVKVFASSPARIPPRRTQVTGLAAGTTAPRVRTPHLFTYRFITCRMAGCLEW